MTARVDEVTVASADVRHTIGRGGETASCWGAVETEGGRCGSDGGGLVFVGRGAGEGVLLS